jgi:hypothetical protein
LTVQIGLWLLISKLAVLHAIVQGGFSRIGLELQVDVAMIHLVELRLRIIT